MANLIALKREREELLSRADNIVASAELTKRPLTAAENADFKQSMTGVSALNTQIAEIEKTGTIRKLQGPHGELLLGNGNAGANNAPRGWQRKPAPTVFSDDYAEGFFRYIQSNGQDVSAAMYEGSSAAGGYAVPIVVDDQIVPLAPQEMAIRRISSVIPTASDIKIPTKASFSVAALKTETSSFGSTPPTIGQFLLSAFMVGQQNDLSWELAQDVPTFQSFLVQDMVVAQQMLEESYYCTGTGSGQPQGLIGNVGLGVVREPDASGNVISISATLDLIGTLNALYHENATFVMQRASSIIIRKAQVGANLFEPVFTRVGKQDYLHGYPVEYVTDFPTAARGNSPVLFGDFKRGYIIGDRGGSGINVKVLDQPKAAQGLITLLTYRRTDGRVRLPEAIQTLTIAAS